MGTLRLGFYCRVLGTVVTVVTVPLAEELAFRGYALRRLIAADFERVSFQRFTALSFFGSLLLFGAWHSGLPAGSLAGAAYALVLYRRGEMIRTTQRRRVREGARSLRAISSRYLSQDLKSPE